MKNVYLLLAVLGTIIPYAQFLPWIAENGLNVAGLFSEMTESRVSAFAWADVVLTVSTIATFAIYDSRRRGHRFPVWPLLACFAVGASLALPLYLYLREVQDDAACGSRT